MTGRTARRGPDRRANRGAFTLLEMLAVVTIIAILIAIAFPAYNAVIYKTRIAQVRSEMAAINSAIAEFKSKYNTEPPSYIRFQTAAGGVPANAGALAPETKAVLRKMFPQINLTAGSPIEASLATAGLWGEELKGIEAMVFFLGGVRRHEDTDGDGSLDPGEDVDGSGALNLTDELVGFSKNPANPFAQPAPGQSNRIPPAFDFDTGRLFASPDGSNVAANPAPLVYRDRLATTLPYVYASTAATGSYRAADFPSGFAGYRKSATGPFWNPNSYQLISAGGDDKYGLGGFYDPTASNRFPNPSPPAPPAQDPRSFEADNLTNFNDGPLGG